MRHTSRKRQSPDPLAPTADPAWLVVRDALGDILASCELAPNADLRAVLMGARSERIADGWDAEEIGARCAIFFARRDGERVLIGIERRLPRGRAGCCLDR